MVINILHNFFHSPPGPYGKRLRVFSLKKGGPAIEGVDNSRFDII